MGQVLAGGLKGGVDAGALTNCVINDWVLLFTPSPCFSSI